MNAPELPASDERLYFLPLGPECPGSCGLCKVLGCLEPSYRDGAALERALDRALSGGYSGVLAPAGLISYPDTDLLIDLCKKRGLRLFLRLHASLGLDLIRSKNQTDFNSLFAKLAGIEVVFWKVEHLLILAELASAFGEKIVRWIYVPRKDTVGKLVNPRSFDHLPVSLRSMLRIQLPPHDEADLHSVTVREGYAHLKAISARFPEIRVAPPEGREIWDFRISKDLGLEPMEKPLFRFQTQKRAAPLEVSVIIPSYNAGPLLKNTLRHLLEQNLDRSLFEILVVDDGSGDGSSELIRNFVAPEAGNLNFSYFYFSRPSPRKMGDGSFRAGIARNLGAKNASGRLLCFLDADILVSPSHLSHLIEKHRENEVIQCVRLHLKNRSENDRVRFVEIDQKKETFVLEPDYWGAFFSVKDWMDLPFFWKYTCTYALSMPSDLFHRIGRFRRTYVFYGFEDTDLGYRLALAGGRFRLDPTVTIHQWSAHERSEYRNSMMKRHLLLSKTAKTFYLNTLDSEVFTHFSGFMRGEKKSGGRVQRWLSRL